MHAHPANEAELDRRARPGLLLERFVGRDDEVHPDAVARRNEFQVNLLG